MTDREEQAKKLTAAIAGLESQRLTLGDDVVNPALAALRSNSPSSRLVPATTGRTTSARS